MIKETDTSTGPAVLLHIDATVFRYDGLSPLGALTPVTDKMPG